MIINCISKSQGRSREAGSEGSETANPRTDEQKSRIRPRIWVSLPRKAKPSKERFKVNVAVAGRKINVLPGEISKKSGANIGSALSVATLRGNFEKSAEVIVVRRLS